MNNEITVEYLEEGISKKVDLDGHGFPENIVFFITPVKNGRQTLSLIDIQVENSSSDEILDYNDEPALVYFDGVFDKKMAIVSVPELSEKILILSGHGSEYELISEVFMYKQGKVRYLGMCEGTMDTNSLRIESDGTFFSNTRSEYFQYMYYVLEYVIHRNELVPLTRWMYALTPIDSEADESYIYKTRIDYEFYDEPFEDSERTEIPEGTEVTFMTTSETGWFEIDVDGTSYYFFMTDCGEIDGDTDFTVDMLFDEITF